MAARFAAIKREAAVRRAAETAGLVRAEGMVGKKRDGADGTQAFREPVERGAFGGIVVDAGDQRTAQDDLRAESVERLKVGEDRRQFAARPSKMPRRIEQLDVPEPKIHERRGGQDRLPRNGAARLDRDVQPGVLRSVKTCKGEVTPQQRFAAGEREPAAGMVVERLVAQDLFEDFGGGELPSAAFGRVAVFARHPFRARIPRLRVVTPGAPQGAPLEEHDGPDAGPVARGEMLNVEDDARHGYTAPGVRAMTSSCMVGLRRVK